jgi:transposase-like protein
MSGKRRRHSAAFKAEVALEAAGQNKAVAAPAKSFRVRPVQIGQWKKRLLDGAESLFSDGRRRDKEDGRARQSELYERIGRLDMEVEWLKKSAARCG